MRFRFLAVAFLVGFLAAKACAQGLTIRDVAFVGASGTAGGGGGGSSPAPSPTEYWDMQEASGNRIGEVSGTVMAPVGGAIGNTASGLYGNAAQWSTTPDLQATLGSSYTSGQSVSINFWMKVSGTGGGDTVVADFWVEAGFNHVVSMLENAPGGFNGFLYNYNTSTSYDVYDSGYSRTTSWRMITLVYDGGTQLLTLYIDGASKGATASAFTLGTAAAPELDFEGFNGMEQTAIDEVYLKIGTALSAEQVTWLYNSGSGRQYSDF